MVRPDLRELAAITRREFANNNVAFCIRLPFDGATALLCGAAQEQDEIVLRAERFRGQVAIHSPIRLRSSQARQFEQTLEAELRPIRVASRAIGKLGIDLAPPAPVRIR